MDLYTVQSWGALAVLSAPQAVLAVALPLAVFCWWLREFALAVLAAASLDAFFPCLPRSTVQTLPAAIFASCYCDWKHLGTGLAREEAGVKAAVLLTHLFLASAAKDSIERHGHHLGLELRLPLGPQTSTALHLRPLHLQAPHALPRSVSTLLH